MTQEQLRMQMLAGIITEGQYKEKLNEIKVNEPGFKKLEDLIEKYKKKLSNQFNLGPSSISWNDEGEPVTLWDDNTQVDFIKKKDWETNKEFYTNNQGIGEINLNGVDIIYVINPF